MKQQRSVFEILWIQSVLLFIKMVVTMSGFGIRSEIICDGMMKTYIDSNRYGKMADHAITRMKEFRKMLK